MRFFFPSMMTCNKSVLRKIDLQSLHTFSGSTPAIRSRTKLAASGNRRATRFRTKSSLNNSMGVVSAFFGRLVARTVMPPAAIRGSFPMPLILDQSSPLRFCRRDIDLCLIAYLDKLLSQSRRSFHQRSECHRRRCNDIRSDRRQVAERILTSTLFETERRERPPQRSPWRVLRCLDSSLGSSRGGRKIHDWILRVVIVQPQQFCVMFNSNCFSLVPIVRNDGDNTCALVSVGCIQLRQVDI